MSESRQSRFDRNKNVNLEFTEHRLDVSPSSGNGKKTRKNSKSKPSKFDPAVEDVAFESYKNRALFTQYRIEGSKSKPPLNTNVSRVQHGSSSPYIRRLPRSQQEAGYMSHDTYNNYHANSDITLNQKVFNRKSILRQNSDDLVHGETVHCTPSSSKSSSLRSSTSSNKRVRFQDEVRRKVVPSPDLVELVRSDSESSLSSSSSGNLHSLSDNSISSGTGSLHDIKQAPGRSHEMDIDDCLASPEYELGKPLSLSKLTRQYSSNDSDYSTETDSLYGLDLINKHEGKYTSADSFHSSAYSSSSSIKLSLPPEKRPNISESTSESSDDDIRRKVKKTYKAKDEDLDSSSSNSTLAETSSSDSEIVLASGTRIKREKFTSGSDFESNAESNTDISSENSGNTKPFWMLTVIEHRSVSPNNDTEFEKEIDFMFRAGKRRKTKSKTEAEAEEIKEYKVEHETISSHESTEVVSTGNNEDQLENSLQTVTVLSDPSLTAITPLEGSELSIQPNSTSAVEDLHSEGSMSSWQGVKAPYDLVKQIVRHAQSSGGSLFNSASLSNSENSLFNVIHGNEHERLRPLYIMIQTEEEMECNPIVVSMGTMTDNHITNTEGNRQYSIPKSTSVSELEVTFARNKQIQKSEYCSRSVQVGLESHTRETNSRSVIKPPKNTLIQLDKNEIKNDLKSRSMTPSSETNDVTASETERTTPSSSIQKDIIATKTSTSNDCSPYENLKLCTASSSINSSATGFNEKSSEERVNKETDTSGAKISSKLYSSSTEGKKSRPKKFAYQKSRSNHETDKKKHSGSGQWFHESDRDSECSFEYVQEDRIIAESLLRKHKLDTIKPDSDSDDYESASSSVSDPEISFIKSKDDIDVNLSLNGHTMRNIETMSSSSCYTSSSMSDTIALREDCPRYTINLSAVSSTSSSTKSDTPQYGKYDLATSKVIVSTSRPEDSLTQPSVGEISAITTRSDNVTSLSPGEVILDSLSSSNKDSVESKNNSGHDSYRNVDQYLQYLGRHDKIHKVEATDNTSSLVDKFPVHSNHNDQSQQSNSGAEHNDIVEDGLRVGTDDSRSCKLTPEILSALRNSCKVKYMTMEANDSDTQNQQRMGILDENISSTNSNAFLLQVDRTISSTLEKIPSLKSELFTSTEKTKNTTSSPYLSPNANINSGIVNVNKVPRLSNFSQTTDDTSLRRRGTSLSCDMPSNKKDMTLYSSYTYSNVEVISDTSSSDDEIIVEQKNRSYRSSYSSRIRASQEAPKGQLVPYDDDDITADLSTDNDVVSLKDYEVFQDKRSDLVYSLVLNRPDEDVDSSTSSDKAAGDAYMNCNSSSTNSKLETEDEITDKSSSRTFASWKEDYGLLRALRWVFCPCAEA